jgi:hypothetical protein
MAKEKERFEADYVANKAIAAKENEIKKGKKEQEAHARKVKRFNEARLAYKDIFDNETDEYRNDAANSGRMAA